MRKKQFLDMIDILTYNKTILMPKGERAHDKEITTKINKILLTSGSRLNALGMVLFENYNRHLSFVTS